MILCLVSYLLFSFAQLVRWIVSNYRAWTLFILFLIFRLDLRKKVFKMSDEEEYEVESIVSKRIKKGKVQNNINF